MLRILKFHLKAGDIQFQCCWVVLDACACAGCIQYINVCSVHLLDLSVSINYFSVDIVFLFRIMQRTDIREPGRCITLLLAKFLGTDFTLHDEWTHKDEDGNFCKHIGDMISIHGLVYRCSWLSAIQYSDSTVPELPHLYIFPGLEWDNINLWCKWSSFYFHVDIPMRMVDHKKFIRMRERINHDQKRTRLLDLNLIKKNGTT